MTQNLRLSVTDQCPVYIGTSPQQAPQHSLLLAQACESWGYQRFWLAEHHNTALFACSSPEIMMGYIAANTKTIRVGSGGVMLSHYSPFKVAEQFRMLEAQYPNRIDLGIGRAPGGDRKASEALAYPGPPTHGEIFTLQARDLVGYLRQELPQDHPFAKLKVTPQLPTCPSVWMLGSGGSTAEFAGILGLGFVLAQFIDSRVDPAPVFNLYRQAFAHHHPDDVATPMLAMAVVCAETREEAYELACVRACSKMVSHLTGNREFLPTPAQAQDSIRQLNQSEQDYFQRCLADIVHGTGAQCREQIEVIADRCQARDVSVVNVTHSLETRLKSYELLARAFEMC